MECVKFERAKIVSNSPECTVLDHGIKDEDMSVVFIRVSGRYPVKGWSVNEKCKLMVFVLNGKGLLFVEDKTVELSENDMVLILPGEKYYWEGNITILVSSTPAWNPEQCKLVE